MFVVVVVVVVVGPFRYLFSLALVVQYLTRLNHEIYCTEMCSVHKEYPTI